MIAISNIWHHPLTTILGVAGSVLCMAIYELPQIASWTIGNAGNPWMIAAGIVSIIVGGLMRDPGTNKQ